MNQHESEIVIWDDIAMGALAILSTFLLMLEYSVPLTYGELLVIGYVDSTIALIFLAEFIIKYSFAPSKKEYLKSNWWYLLASIPLTTPLTQALRLLRLVRLIRLLRLGTGMKEISIYLRRFFTQTYLVYVITIWMIIVFSGAMVFFAIEHAVNPHVQSLFDAFWWAMATVTTVGYGDIYPVTTAGRIVGIMLMIAGIGTSGVFTALIASFLIREK